MILDIPDFLQHECNESWYVFCFENCSDLSYSRFFQQKFYMYMFLCFTYHNTINNSGKGSVKGLISLKTNIFLTCCCRFQSDLIHLNSILTIKMPIVANNWNLETCKKK